MLQSYGILVNSKEGASYYKEGNAKESIMKENESFDLSSSPKSHTY